MSKNNSSTNNSGTGVLGLLGLLGLLGVLFVGLKLTGYINWSWWWVTAPFWGGAALVLAIGLLILTVMLVKFLIERDHK